MVHAGTLERFRKRHFFGPNHVIVASTTRLRGHLLTSIMVDYYRWRASASPINSEAIEIINHGLDWPYERTSQTSSAYDNGSRLTLLLGTAAKSPSCHSAVARRGVEQT
jgi:hypothetical protein